MAGFRTDETTTVLNLTGLNLTLGCFGVRCAYLCAHGMTTTANELELSNSKGVAKSETVSYVCVCVCACAYVCI